MLARNQKPLLNLCYSMDINSHPSTLLTSKHPLPLRPWPSILYLAVCCAYTGTCDFVCTKCHVQHLVGRYVCAHICGCIYAVFAMYSSVR